MATLARDKPRRISAAPTDYNAFPVIASDIVYAGAGVGEASSAGTARPLEGGDTFLGMAIEQADNSDGAAAAIDVQVATRGIVHGVTAIAGLSGGIADLGADVYMSDDDTFTNTASGATKIGKVIGYRDSAYEVYFESDLHIVS